MNKYVMAAAGLLMTFAFASCEKINGDGPMVTEVRNETGFSGIDVRMSANVTYRQAPEYKVEVTAQDDILRVLKTNVVNNKLVIRFENDVRVWRYDGIRVEVTGPELNNLRMSGSGSIQTLGTVRTGSMELDISGSGNIQMAELVANSIDGSISGSGEITVLQGVVTDEQLRISGSGGIDLTGVAAKTARTRTSGSGNMRLKVSDRLEATISGSGSVYYLGNPTVQVTRSGSGKVQPQ